MTFTTYPCKVCMNWKAGYKMRKVSKYISKNMLSEFLK